MFVEIILAIFLTCILLLVGVYAAKASSKVGSISGYSKDSNMDAAYVALTWAAFLCWFTVAIFVVGFILYILSFFIGVGEVLTAESIAASAAGQGSIIINIFNGFIALLIFIIGVFSIKGAVDIKKSALYSGSTDAKEAYKAAIYASVISMISIAILIGLWIYTFYEKKKKAKEAKERQQKVGQAKLIKSERLQKQKLALKQASITPGQVKNLASAPF